MSLTNQEVHSIPDLFFQFSQDIQQDKQEYLEWARRKIKVLPAKEFYQWMITQKGSAVMGATAWYFNRYAPTGSVNFESAINEDGFIVEGEDYRDLIPYAKEHEVQESFARIAQRKGIAVDDPHANVGMVEEFKLAAADRKHHRLYEYMTRAAPNRTHEYQSAYDLVKSTK